MVPENPDDLGEEELEALQEQMDEDYEVGGVELRAAPRDVGRPGAREVSSAWVHAARRRAVRGVRACWRHGAWGAHKPARLGLRTRSPASVPNSPSTQPPSFPAPASTVRPPRPRDKVLF